MSLSMFEDVHWRCVDRRSLRMVETSSFVGREPMASRDVGKGSSTGRGGRAQWSEVKAWKKVVRGGGGGFVERGSEAVRCC